jgi:hypothetical protein
MLPADIEMLAQYGLTPVVSPALVVTKLEDADDIDTNGAVRVESATTDALLEERNAAYDLGFLVHCYSPNEIEAKNLDCKVAAYVCAVRGLTIAGYYIVDVVNYVGGTKLPEPGVEGLTRYRSAVTWRVAAKVM